MCNNGVIVAVIVVVVNLCFCVRQSLWSMKQTGWEKWVSSQCCVGGDGCLWLSWESLVVEIFF